MAYYEFAILVNDSFKRQLDCLDRSELETIREKLGFLATGLWEGGLRVKKLRGAEGIAVFEARMSRGERLLFTMGREGDRATLYAWGIEAHDDVDRARHSILPENAPFLGFEPLSVEQRAELVMDELGSECFMQGGFEGQGLPWAGPQRWRVLDDLGWKRMLDSSLGEKAELRLHLTEGQRAVLEEPPPLFLSGTAGSGKTTIAVHYLCRPLPGGTRRLFVTKHSNLCAYSRGLYEDLVAGREEGEALEAPRFATYREIAREIVDAGAGAGTAFESSREVDFPAFERMLRERREFSALDPELAWEEIRGIIKGAKPALNLGRYRSLVSRFAEGVISAREVRELEDMLGAIKDFDFMPLIEDFIGTKTGFEGYGEFLRFHSSAARADRGSALPVHSRIEDCLRRKAGELGTALLSFGEYQALGKKRAPAFKHDRAGIYAAARWYQDRLKAEGLWDEIDLTRRAIDTLAAAGGRGFSSWDLLVCDEAQDFTNVHIFLLFRLVADPTNVVMAGDVKQIIDPSGFRWADLRALFWERGLKAPELLRLDFNFRSVGGIVSIGNALIDLKKRLAQIQSGESRECWKFLGKTPCLLSGVDEARLAAELSASGAGSAVITRDPRTRDRLREITGSQLVFTAVEAKGLEFDTVLLWKPTPVAGEIAALWRHLAVDDRLAQGLEARIVHEINLYYVAVTRARNCLVVYEENLDFWKQEEFEGLFIRSSELAVLRETWRSLSSPEEWRGQAEYYLERGYLRAAAECFRNAGEVDRESLARGLALFEEGRFEEAAGILEAAGQRGKAALAYEESGQHRRASELWKAEGESGRSLVCHARALEKEGAFAAAASQWLALGDAQSALRALECGADRGAVGELCRSMELMDRAAVAFTAAARHADAAACWLEAQDRRKAADSFFAAGDWERAAEFYSLEGQHPRLPDCWLRAGHYAKAAQGYLQAHELAKAIEAYRDLLKADPSAEPLLSQEAEALAETKPLEAAVRLSALGAAARAGDLFHLHGEGGLALAEFREVGKDEEAAIRLEAQGEYLEAARALERSCPASDEVIRLLKRQIHGRPKDEKSDIGLARKLIAEAKALEAAGDLNRAANRFAATVQIKEARRCLLKLDRDDLAFKLFCNLGLHEEMGVFIKNKWRIRISHNMVMAEATSMRDSGYPQPFLPRWHCLLDALGRCRGVENLAEQDFRDELAALLPIGNEEAYRNLADMSHLGALDLLVRIGHMNALCLLWRAAVGAMKPDEPYAREFASRIEAAAQKEESPSWFTAFLAYMRGEGGAGSGQLRGIEAWNSLFFCVATGRAIMAHNWHRERGAAKDFETLATYLGIEAQVAEGLETQADFADAALWFAMAGMPKDALRCRFKTGEYVANLQLLEALEKHLEASDKGKEKAGAGGDSG